MPTNEQVEAWTVQAANDLEKKIGPNACVIVMAMDVGEKAPWAVEYRGGPLFVIFLEKICSRAIDKKLLPNSTRE